MQEGNYTCQASNKYGTDLQKFSVVFNGEFFCLLVIYTECTIVRINFNPFLHDNIRENMQVRPKISFKYRYI